MAIFKPVSKLILINVFVFSLTLSIKSYLSNTIVLKSNKVLIVFYLSINFSYIKGSIRIRRGVYLVFLLTLISLCSP